MKKGAASSAGQAGKKKPGAASVVVKQSNTLDNYFKNNPVKKEVKEEENELVVPKLAEAEAESIEHEQVQVREAKRVCVESSGSEDSNQSGQASQAADAGFFGAIKTVSIETFKNYFKREAKPAESQVKTEPRAVESVTRKTRSRGAMSQVDDQDELPEPSGDRAEPKVYRPCPFYKRLEDTKICVDAFNYGTIDKCDAYFLSHFHYDHFIGLRKDFQNQMYCSQVTANLVMSKIKVDKKFINVIEMNKFINVYDVDDRVQVKLLDANHCPGAVMFLFKITLNRSSPKHILHTGDFRASASLVQSLKEMNLKLDVVYLDTTYCDENYSFLPQDQVVRLGVETVKRELSVNPKALIVCGTYTIGKERVFIAIADALDKKICVSREKFNTLKCLDDPKLTKMLTLDPNQTNIHVLPMGQFNYKDLPNYLAKFPDYHYLIAIKPTGWTHKAQPKSGMQPGLSVETRGKNFIMYGLEYSEHSSFAELKNFVETLKPKKIIPTVNCANKDYRERMKTYFNLWTYGGGVGKAATF